MLRRGITPVVAIVLLLMMTVAASGGAYAWMQNLQDEAGGRAEEDLRTDLSVKSIECRGNVVNVSISNTGETEVLTNDATVYLYDGDGDLIDAVGRDYSGAGFGTPGGFDEIRAVFGTGMDHGEYEVEVAFDEATTRTRCDADPILNSTYPLYTGWTPSPTFDCAGTTMMGGYNNFGSGDASTRVIPDLDAGTYNVTFDYIHLDSWDGESGLFYWNGQQQWSRSHSGTGSNVCGNSGYSDSDGLAYGDVQLTVTHGGGDATMVFNSSLDQAANDESWGVTNVTVLRQQ